MKSKKIDNLPLKAILEDTLTIFWAEWLDLRARMAQIASTGLISLLIYVLAFGLGLGNTH